MALYAAVTTGKGSAAIATIHVSGREASMLLSKFFSPATKNPPLFEPGRILIGSITNNGKIIDQVTIGCEEKNDFAIHCHGNPLIVEQIAQLLQQNGAELLTAQEFLNRTISQQSNLCSIEIEAKIAQLQAKTLAGTQLIANQIHTGLAKEAKRLLNETEQASLDEIQKIAIKILEQSKIAKLITDGCRIILIGPPNSGKSTLLNTLAGRDKAIVSHIEGTTRDWVEAQCNVDPLEVTLIDTAGLDVIVSTHSDIDQVAQDKTGEILSQADLVLLVLDTSRPTEQIPTEIKRMLAGKLVLTVLNKSDLPKAFETNMLSKELGEPVRISAKENKGIDELKRRILKVTGTDTFNLNTTIVFTARQHDIISQLAGAKTKQQAGSLISQLLNGPVAV